MMYGNIANHEAFLRRKLEEQQQAIELEGRRFMGLHLLDLKIRGHHLGSSPATTVVGQGEGGKGSGNGNAVQLEDVIVQGPLLDPKQGLFEWSSIHGSFRGRVTSNRIRGFWL